MENLYFPAVSIITVNYNGVRFLAGLFDSLSRLDYPAEKIEIIMVDNNSSDDSCEFVSRKYPNVKIIRSDKNKGYAGGNNAGFRIARGEYIALINNDCTVEKQWLSGLVKTLLQQGATLKAGAAGSKVLFFYSYLLLEFNTGGMPLLVNDFIINNGEKCGKLGVCGPQENLCRSIRFISKCSPASRSSDGSVTSWTLNDGAVIAVPIADENNDIALTMEISNSADIAGELAVSLGEKERKARIFSGQAQPEVSKIRLEIQKKYFDYKVDLVNSCGIEINRSFYARDRGADAVDAGQYNTADEIFAPSGSSLLISRRMLDETGFFESSFFTYYEDVDLFWRARLKGWKVFFCPESVARHHHCGTGVEWSPLFTYHVLKNRMITIFRCGWCGIFTRSYFAFIASAALAAAGCLRQAFHSKRCSRPDIPVRLRIIFEFFYLMPKNLISRIRIRSTKRIPDSEIKKFMTVF